MPLIRSLIRGTDFSRFIDFVTPAFFDVMPARGLFSAAGQLVKGYRDKDAFAHAVAHRRARADRGALSVRVATDSESSLPRLEQLSEAEREAVGSAALEIYFHQLYDDEGPTLLNISSQRFSHDGDHPVWNPGPGVYAWPPEFRAALGDVYRSFYREGGKSLEASLEPLNLAPAADLFKAHFGSGDQRSVEFRVETFVDAFHQVFLCCKDNGIRLDPAFLALGIYLATMYETLEAVGRPLDVRAAFDAAHPGD